MANFDESKHPRAEDGKFTSGSGSSSTQSTGEKTYRQNASYGEILGKSETTNNKEAEPAKKQNILKQSQDAPAKKPHTSNTQVYEVFTSASYLSNGQKHHNAFKEYVKAESEQDAKKILTKRLKADGYGDIELDRPIGITMDDWKGYVKAGYADDEEILNNDEYETVDN